jgi:hypothetical protein
MANYLLQESGDRFWLEDLSGYILLESQPMPSTVWLDSYLTTSVHLSDKTKTKCDVSERTMSRVTVSDRIP